MDVSRIQVDRICECYRALMDAESRAFYGHELGDAEVRKGTSYGRLTAISRATGKSVTKDSATSTAHVSYGGVEFWTYLDTKDMKGGAISG